MLHQITIRNNNDVEYQNLVTMLITHFPDPMYVVSSYFISNLILNCVFRKRT